LRRAIRGIAKGEAPVGVEAVDVEGFNEGVMLGDETGVENEVSVSKVQGDLNGDETSVERRATPTCAHNEICKLFFEKGRPYYCCPRPDHGRCDTFIWRGDFKDPIDDTSQDQDKVPVESGQAFVKISQLQGRPIPKALLREALDELAAIDTAEMDQAEEGLGNVKCDGDHLDVAAEEDRGRGSMSSWVLPDVPEEEEYDVVGREGVSVGSNRI
jgi:hypothetical protein